MNTIFRNDRVILMKEYDKLKAVGETFEVANVTNTSVVLRHPVTKVAVGAVDIKDFYNYFTKEIQGWTDWTVLVINGGQTVGWYRTNGKKVQVKTNDGERAEATCNKTDRFNLYLGVNLAFSRCHKKFLQKVKTEIESQFVSAEHDLKSIDNQILELTKMARPITEEIKKEQSV